MSDNSKTPQPFDLVLGGNNPPKGEAIKRKKEQPQIKSEEELLRLAEKSAAKMRDASEAILIEQNKNNASASEISSKSEQTQVSTQQNIFNRVVIKCNLCQAKLRVPMGKVGIIECPRCQLEFNADTRDKNNLTNQQNIFNNKSQIENETKSNESQSSSETSGEGCCETGCGCLFLLILIAGIAQFFT